MKERWFENSVVYQIYPMSFKDSNGDGFGDIPGIISKLDYLFHLGIDVIWLSPVYLSPLDDNGYDISDYYKIHPLFGSNDTFKELLDKAHHLGIKVIMDLVVNHTSDEHIWFKKALKGIEPYKDYYVFRKSLNGYPNDIQSVFSGPAWTYLEEVEAYYFHLFSQKQPDLNWANKSLREEIYTMINWWLDQGIDGFRLDVIDLIGKDIDNKVISNGPHLQARLSEMYERCFKGRKIFTVGETPSASIEQAKQFTQTKKPLLDMIFNFEHVGLDEISGKGKWVLKPLSIKELKVTFEKWQVGLNGIGWNSLYWSNHDQPRAVSRFGDDQEYRVESAKMLATVLHFMQGTPFIYQGEEIGMTNVKFDDLEDYRDIETHNMAKEKLEDGWTIKDVMKSIYAKGRDNARTPMQWNSESYAGFSTSKPWIKVNPNYKRINVENARNDKNSIYYFYKQLIALRKTEPTIVHGTFKMLDSANNLMHYQRIDDDHVLNVYCNFSDELVPVKFDQTSNVLIHNYPGFDKTNQSLRAYESVVLKSKINGKG